jgi:hypothetical protein
MTSFLPTLWRAGSLLAVNLLFLMMWGFAGIDKVRTGVPTWFGSKFGATFLAKFPGLTATFWLLAASELVGFALALAALGRVEFLRNQTPKLMLTTLVWSLFIFLELAFGLWLSSDFNGTFNMFVYFGITLFILHYVAYRGNAGWQMTNG